MCLTSSDSLCLVMLSGDVKQSVRCQEDEADNLAQLITATFGLEAADLSLSAAASVACDPASRRELEVVSIGAGDTVTNHSTASGHVTAATPAIGQDTVWVLTNLTAAEQLQEGEQAEAAAVADSVAETEYWCLAAAAPGSETVVAVVCEEAGGGEVASLRKCCPGTQALAPDLSCQDTGPAFITFNLSHLGVCGVELTAATLQTPRWSWPRARWCPPPRCGPRRATAGPWPRPATAAAGAGPDTPRWRTAWRA